MLNYLSPKSPGTGLLESAIRSRFRVISGAQLRVQFSFTCEKGFQTRLATCNLLRGKIHYVNYVGSESPGTGLLKSAIRLRFQVIVGARLRLQCVFQCELGVQTLLTTCNLFQGQDTVDNTMYVPKALAKGSLNQQSDEDSGYFGCVTIYLFPFWRFLAFLVWNPQTCHFFNCT